jgi:hypothetical protein
VGGVGVVGGRAVKARVRALTSDEVVWVDRAVRAHFAAMGRKGGLVRSAAKTAAARANGAKRKKGEGT